MDIIPIHRGEGYSISSASNAGNNTSSTFRAGNNCKWGINLSIKRSMESLCSAGYLKHFPSPICQRGSWFIIDENLGGHFSYSSCFRWLKIGTRQIGNLYVCFPEWNPGETKLRYPSQVVCASSSARVVFLPLKKGNVVQVVLLLLTKRVIFWGGFIQLFLWFV